MANGQGLIELLVQIKDEATSRFDHLIHKVVELTGVMDILRGVIIAVTAGTLVGWVETLVNAYAEGELAVTKLNAALRVSGQYTDEGSKQIQDMAERMQSLTTTSSTAAIQISATIGAIAKDLTVGQLAQMQQAAIALSDAHGVSVQRASMMIARSLEGQSNMLRRWGIDLDTSSTAQERANVIIEKTNGLFDISQAAAATLSGRIAQMHNEWHDLQQAVGEVIARFLGLDEKTTTLRDRIHALTLAVKQHGGEWIQSAGYVVAAFRVIGAAIDLLVELGVQLLGGFFTWLKDSLLGFAGIVTLAFDATWESLKWVVKAGINKAFIQPLNEMLELADDIAKKFGRRVEFRIGELDTTGAFKNTVKDLHDLGAIGKDVLDDLHNRFLIVKDAFEHVGDTLQPLLNPKPAGVEPLAGFGKAGGGKNVGTFGETDPAEEARRLLRENQLLQAQYAAGVIGLDEYNAGVLRLIESTKKLLENTHLTKEEQVQLLNALKQLGGGISVIDDLLRENRLLDAQYAAGTIGIDAYNKGIANQIAHIKDLLDHTKLTKEQTLALLGALGQLQGMSIGARLHDEFLNVKKITESTNEDIAKMVIGFRDQMTNAITTAFEAHKNFGETLKKEVGKAAAHYAILSVGRAIMETAEGVAASFFNPPAAAAHFHAAETFMIAAAAMGSIGAAAGGFAGGGSGQSAAEATNKAVSKQADGITIIVPAGLTNSQQWVEELIDKIDQANDRRVTVRTAGGSEA